MEPPTSFQAVAIGFVRSSLTDPETAPKQGDEGAPEATIVVESHALAALRGLSAGDDVLVLTWLDRARRDVLEVHPRGDLTREPQGVFATRSPHRPNPIGLHPVQIVSRGRHHARPKPRGARRHARHRPQARVERGRERAVNSRQQPSASR